MTSPASPLRSTLTLLAFVLVTFAAPACSAFIAPGAWYAALNKPAWNPPSWIFGPAWTLLYTLMAIAAWLVWRRGGFRAQRGPLTWYAIQLALNAAWTPIFFGAHALGWGLVEIVALWTAILITLLRFHRVRPGAAWLLAPYLAWVTFATALNFTLWRLNAV